MQGSSKKNNLASKQAVRKRNPSGPPQNQETPTANSSIPFTSGKTTSCYFCKRSAPPLVSLSPSHIINIQGCAHELCINSRGCCMCGVVGLLVECGAPECSRLIHPWCSKAYSLADKDTVLCDMHDSRARKKDSSRLTFIKTQCRKIPNSSLWKGEYKSRESPAAHCNGYVFWFIINLEYFPQGFNLSYFPEFPLIQSVQCDSQLPSEESLKKDNHFVDNLIRLYERELRHLSQKNSKIKDEIKEKTHPISVGSVKDMSEDEKIIAEIKCLKYEWANDEYLSYYEKNSHFEPQEKEVNSFAGLRKHQDKRTQQVTCAVCNEKECPDLDPFVTCESCSINVHLKCYGVPQFAHSWKCDPCQIYSKQQTQSLHCALCPKKGGALKPTVHKNDGSMNLPNYTLPYPSRSKNEKILYVWCHVFCALHIEKVVFQDLTNLEGIDLSQIDPADFCYECEVCRTCKGACVKCCFARCNAAFHPECGKGYYVTTRTSEDKIYCPLHRPLQLRKMLESSEKKIVDDLFKFCKSFEKWEQKYQVPMRPVKRKRESRPKNSNGRSFTNDEDLTLEFRIQQFLYKLNLSQKDPFILHINLQASTRKSKIGITRPNFYTLIIPEVILEERLSIPNRTPEECFKRYQDTLYSRLRNDILLRGKRLNIYHGLDLVCFRKDSRRSSKKKRRPTPKQSKEKYCFCDRPYFYSLPKDPSWSEEFYEQKLKENEMIACTCCGNWFHLVCVDYPGTGEEACFDDTWKCPNCINRSNKKKNNGAFNMKYLNKGAIMSDLKEGVVTRRAINKTK
mmetsp:Transcript_12188/g.17751  ORF Transcript_12188/g.17751 Transcript_12188/m.17751 type:complete len:792 (-) Transcript_12188:44-2419(-)